LGGKVLWRFQEHFRAFLRSPQTKNAKGNHRLEIWGPSGRNSKKSDTKKLGGFKVKKLSVEFFVSGPPGRVFMVKYAIGKNSKPGSGYFVFRWDYMDYRSDPQ
jgi:hypothetical protein